MKLHPILSLFSLTCLCFVSCQSKNTAEDSGTGSDTQGQADQQSGNTLADASPFSKALAEVNAQCPEDYPEVVTPLPESKDFARIDTAKLMKMLESWNPSLRTQAAVALSERGEEVLGLLMQGMQSENWMIRAGSTTALAAIIKQKLNGLDKGQQQTLKEKHADIIAGFIRLTGDDRLEVRVAALNGLTTVAPQTAAAAKAVLGLCDDPDDYLAQDAMITLEKSFNFKALEQGELIPALKEALKSSLPRGKGHIIRIIKRMQPEAQRQFVPELLAHLDWKPMRDTMFGAGGQEDAIVLLTQMKEKQLIERLPRLMAKPMRGPGLFLPCLKAAKAFGKDAKVIVPDLKAIYADIKANGKNTKVRVGRDVEQSLEQLQQTIQYIDSL
ncbi:MAG: hypothetical protein KJO79_00200 [Verrucomicrobiae bacterium]|nr:hypothetical protein [Verrucomicrobiae bacterium]NNJ85566.1 hypothetical protein [Akkermansiaceae bacterium]